MQLPTNLNVITVQSLGQPVGELWRELQTEVTKNTDFYVAAPLSKTPLPIYDWIVEHANSFSNWNKTHFVLMDEQVEGERSPFQYVSTDDTASYERFVRRHFFERLTEPIEVLKPELAELASFKPPLDLLILALGVDGNYANVMPDTPIETGWHVAHLTPKYNAFHTHQANSSYAGATFREYGMSLGPQQVLSAQRVVVIVSGSAKREMVQRLLSYDAFDPAFPLSIVYHPDVRQRVTLYITTDVFGPSTD